MQSYEKRSRWIASSSRYRDIKHSGATTQVVIQKLKSVFAQWGIPEEDDTPIPEISSESTPKGVQNRGPPVEGSLGNICVTERTLNRITFFG